MRARVDELGMKRLLLTMLALTALSAIMSVLTWQIVGAPDRSVPCSESDLKEGHVCLKTVLSWGEDQVLWVDARKRKEWQKNGIKNSLLFNDQKDENLDDLDAAFMEVQAVTPRPHVVIYCDTDACGTSEIVAKHLRENFAEMLGFKVWVLYGGWKALAAEEMIP